MQKTRKTSQILSNVLQLNSSPGVHRRKLKLGKTPFRPCQNGERSMINGHPQETTRYPRDRDRSCWGSDSDGRRVAAISALLQLFHALAVASRYLTNIGKVGLWAWIGLLWDYVLGLIRFGPAALTRWFCRRAGMATIKLETSPRGLRLPWVSGACGWFSVNEHRADGAPAFRCLMGGEKRHEPPTWNPRGCRKRLPRPVVELRVPVGHRAFCSLGRPHLDRRHAAQAEQPPATTPGASRERKGAKRSDKRT